MTEILCRNLAINHIVWENLSKTENIPSGDFGRFSQNREAYLGEVVLKSDVEKIVYSVDFECVKK